MSHFRQWRAAAIARAHPLRRLAALLDVSAVLLAAVPSLVLAQEELPTVTEARTVNDRTVGIVFHYEDIYRELLKDVTAAMEEAEEVRIVPMIGGSHVQTVYDMLYLQGVDFGITHADVIEFMAREQNYGRGYRHIRNVTEILREKIAIVAGEGYESLDDLAGEKVNVRYAGSGADVTASIVLDILGIEVEKTRFDKLEALEKVKSGEIAATFHLIEEPEEAFTSLDPDDGVTLVELPSDERLLAHYHAAKLEPEDFPALISEGSAIPTLSVPVVIAAYNWTPADPFRYGKVQRFASALIANLETLKENDDSGRWADVSIETDVPGLERYALVDEILAERERLAQQRDLEAREAEIAELNDRREALIARLTSSLDDEAADPAELEELERLVEQFQQRLDSGE